ncbi:jg9996 [Pararge aegeria aegeria]|uniref:allantoinase n=1 Tax=Pararge aegeria aegeria TaxID=348720 RepID=A0A8S4SIC9_9NEOP|nr:jg9996 [Pararge aegeria aegeria]
MSLYYLFIFILLVSEISCRGFQIENRERQLFLSRNVVTESGEFDGGVLVDINGKIEGVLTRESIIELLSNDEASLEVIDGGNWALMAGGVDSHVHVNEPGRTTWEGYVTATRAAAAGGFTTIVDMPLNSVPPTTTMENFKIKTSSAREEAYVDVAFWGGIVPGNEVELKNLINAGVVGFKGFLIDSGVSEFPNVDTNDLDKIFTTLNGTNTVLAFHAEYPISNGSQCEGCDSTDPFLYNTYLASRPPEMELGAVSLLAKYIAKYDVHVHVVHVSAADVIPLLEQAREQRIQSGSTRWRGGVTAETCGHYLTLSSEQIPPGHSEFKCSPPIRSITNKLKLWEYIRDRRLDLVASDHSPTVADKKTSNFMSAWGGISSVQFGLSLFWTEAKARGFSLSALSHYLSSGPAHLVGLGNQKGALKAGYDADLVFFDPDASFVVTPDIIVYKNKISPYMYRVLNGKVMQTFLRGQLIYSDGEVLETPKGQLLVNAF